MVQKHHLRKDPSCGRLSIILSFRTLDLLIHSENKSRNSERFEKNLPAIEYSHQISISISTNQMISIARSALSDIPAVRVSALICK